MFCSYRKFPFGKNTNNKGKWYDILLNKNLHAFVNMTKEKMYVYDIIPLALSTPVGSGDYISERTSLSLRKLNGRCIVFIPSEEEGNFKINES